MAEKKEKLLELKILVKSIKLNKNILNKININTLKNGSLPSLKNVITGNKASLNEILKNFKEFKNFSKDIISQIETDMKYDIYVKRQMSDIKAFELEQKIQIPNNINYDEIIGLSNESKDILLKFKPQTLRQASLLPGFTSSAAFLILSFLKRKFNKSA